MLPKSREFAIGLANFSLAKILDFLLERYSRSYFEIQLYRAYERKGYKPNF